MWGVAEVDELRQLCCVGSGQEEAGTVGKRARTAGRGTAEGISRQLFCSTIITVVYCSMSSSSVSVVISSFLCVLSGTVIVVCDETVQEMEAAKQYQELIEKQKVCSLFLLTWSLISR